MKAFREDDVIRWDERHSWVTLPCLIGRSIVLFGLMVLFSLCSLASAHPISMTQTDGYATRTELKISIDLFVEDLFLFHNLQPTDDNYLSKKDIAEAAEKHKAFLLERFTIRDAEGALIPGKVVKVDLPVMEEKGIPMTDLMLHSLVYRLEYAMPPGTEFLTFSQTMGTTSFGFPAIMMLRLKQEGSDVPYMAEMRTNEPHTIRLDWEHPPLPPEASEKEWEEWDAKRKEKELGITSYSSVYSFLYVEDYEVRHEILVPLLTLEASVPLVHKDPDFVEVAEQDGAKPAIETYFQKANPIKIDGITVKPTVQRLDFYGLDFKDFAQKADRKRVSVSNARVGIILSYSTKSPPMSVELTWDMFNKYIWGAQTVIFAYDQTHSQLFSPYQKTYQWTNPGRPAPVPVDKVSQLLPPLRRWSIPLISASTMGLGLLITLLSFRRPVVAGGVMLVSVVFAAVMLPFGRIEVQNPFVNPPRLGEAEARSVLETLHKNIYRAFDHHDEQSVYDSLEKSISGPLLEKTYLAVREGLVMQEQGGAVSHVSGVKLVDGKLLPPASGNRDPRAFDMQVVWDVEGTVEHWGHIHTRTNEYEATFTVEPEGDAWKITALDVTGQKRKSFQTRLRNINSSSEPSK